VPGTTGTPAAIAAWRAAVPGAMTKLNSGE